MSDPAYRPAGEILGALSIMPLPRETMIVEAVMVIKAIGEDGKISWYTRYSEDLHGVEALGALRAATLLQERSVMDAYEPDPEDD
jgi:hypothetical protein